MFPFGSWAAWSILQCQEMILKVLYVTCRNLESSPLSAFCFEVIMQSEHIKYHAKLHLFTSFVGYLCHAESVSSLLTKGKEKWHTDHFGSVQNDDTLRESEREREFKVGVGEKINSHNNLNNLISKCLLIPWRWWSNKGGTQLRGQCRTQTLYSAHARVGSSFWEGSGGKRVLISWLNK